MRITGESAEQRKFTVTVIHGPWPWHFSKKRWGEMPLSGVGQEMGSGHFLVVQWLRLHCPSAGGPGLITGQGTRSHMTQLKGVCAVTKIKNPAFCNWDPAQPNKYLRKKRERWVLLWDWGLRYLYERNTMPISPGDGGIRWVCCHNDLRSTDWWNLSAQILPMHTPKIPEWQLHQISERWTQSRESQPWLQCPKHMLSLEDSRPLLFLSGSGILSQAHTVPHISWQMHLTSQLTPIKKITEFAPSL